MLSLVQQVLGRGRLGSSIGHSALGLVRAYLVSVVLVTKVVVRSLFLQLSCDSICIGKVLIALRRGNANGSSLVCMLLA